MAQYGMGGAESISSFCNGGLLTPWKVGEAVETDPGILNKEA